MGKGKNKNKSNQKGGVSDSQQGELQRHRQELEQDLMTFQEEKRLFQEELQQREQELKQGLERVHAVEEDVNSYLEEVRIQKLALLEEEMNTVQSVELARITKEQEAQRLKLDQEWNQRGEQMDQQMRERLKHTDALVEERETELRIKEKSVREERSNLQKQQRSLLEQEHQLQLAFQEKEASLTRALEAKEKKLQHQQEDVLLEQGQLRGLIARLQEEKVRTEQNYQQQLTDIQRRLGDAEEKYQSLWKKHQDQDRTLREFQEELGGDLQSHHNKIGELTRRNLELKKELSLSVPRSVEEDYKTLREECQNLTTQRNQWENSVLKCQSLELAQQDLTHQLALSQGEIRFHSSEKEQLLVENNNLKEKVNELTLRYCTTDVLSEDASRRVAQITEGYTLSSPEESFPKDMEELDWLQYILRKCRDAQMEFPLRIFLAFHTAMKISDWSIVTVLAGVSGTGKSKLPELYAAYGGLNFISVPVQEDWDGQEKLLGYFNTMDNRFEPKPLLQFLLSVTQVPPDRKGILEKQLASDMDEAKRLYVEDGERTVSLVLLDEMNLAHVEEYFAEFLSKLENRRGLRDVPAIDVKLGTGIPDYPLKLRRNILWTGTMNQDETTKSLSDKVLDRGVVINFPRPDVFLRRESQKVQGTGEYRLPYKLWRKWLTRDTSYSVQVDQVGVMINYEAKWELIGAPPDEASPQWTNYKAILEQINRLMTQEGRALGHRVWQATEYYVVNHPLVIHEMRHSYHPEKELCVLTSGLKSAIALAVEDQLVQKILPKLRGVDYDENGTLDEIGRVIATHFPSISQDYQNACAQGQGQFMWVTSRYGDNLHALQPWFDLLDPSEAESEME